MKRPRDEEEARPHEGEPRRLRKHVGRQVEDWFGDFYAVQTKRHGWVLMGALRVATDMTPGLFGHRNDDAPRRGKVSLVEATAEPCGRTASWPDAQLAVLSDIASAVIGKAPVSATAMREIFHTQLGSQGLLPIRTTQWARAFLAEGGHRWRRRARLGAGVHAE